jgi:hypothetical protein
MFGFLKSLFSTSKWNSEAGQQELAELILQGAMKANASGRPIQVNMRDVLALQTKHGWPFRETADRCIHAASLIKTRASPEIYMAAKYEATALYDSLKTAMKHS